MLLDAAPNPGGLSTVLRTPQGRVFEPGIKGFWYQYKNIDELVKTLEVREPFTPWCRSSYWSPQGLQVQSPVFQDLPRLPTPLGSLLYTSPYFTSLPLLDRLSATSLILPLLEHDRDADTYAYYDKMSAYELFRQYGVSQRLYREFLEPMLLVTLFVPPEKLSAAAALGALYYFVLAHQPDFDVRWCRGAVGEVIFAPWLRWLQQRGATVLGGRRVTEVLPGEKQQNLPGRVVAEDAAGVCEAWPADVVVLAAPPGPLLSRSPLLAAQRELRGAAGLARSDVLAARIWLDRRVVPPTPSNVVAGFDHAIGGTFFDLNALQEQYRDEAGSVVEVDLYHSGQLLALDDSQLLHQLQHKYLAGCLPEYGRARVLDAAVQRFPRAVTAFSPGSAALTPPIATQLPNTFLAGDWVAQGPGTHGAKGLSQEKAYVTGLQAGNLAAQYLGLAAGVSVLEVEEDEPHVAALKSAGVRASSLARRLPGLPLARL